MRIFRAHHYKPIEEIRHNLSALPSHWQAVISHIPWIVLPDDLSPLFIGLMYEEAKTHDGRLYSKSGGWCCPTEGYAYVRWQPHIYLNHSGAWGAIHEVAHALEEVWHLDVEKFFKPGKAFYEYMKSNASEYFACAVEAFLTPAQNDKLWNNHHLAKQDFALWEYLSWRLKHRK